MNTVKEVMTRDVDCCTVLDNVYEVAVKMKKLDVGAIPILDENKQLVGMITDRDIVVRGVAEKHPGSTKVEEIMSDDLITIQPDAILEEAANLMADHQIRRLPVVDENKRLVGILAIGDLAVRTLSDDQAKVALSKISEKEHRIH